MCSALKRDLNKAEHERKASEELRKQFESELQNALHSSRKYIFILPLTPFLNIVCRRSQADMIQTLQILAKSLR